MAEFHQPPGEADLGQRLITLGRQIEFPPTPPLAQRVQQRLAATPDRRHRPGWPWVRRCAIAVAALVLAFVVVLLAIPGARMALAGRLGLPGIEIRQVPSAPRLPVTATPSTATLTPAAQAAPVATPIATATPEPTATPLPLGQRLHLGQQMTLAGARQRVSFPIALPARLGAPDAIYVDTGTPGGAVTLVYRPRTGLPVTNETGVGMLLGEFQGSTEQVFISKMAGPGTTIAPVTVDGQPGFWLTGQPHEFLYRDADGVTRQLVLRLAGNTLLWTHSNLTLRIESALSKDAALSIADSVR